jgi:hypothetical protein
VCVLVGLAERACGAALPLTHAVRRVPTGLQHACVSNDKSYKSRAEAVHLFAF